MSNQMITTQNYTIEQTSLPLSIEEKPFQPKTDVDSSNTDRNHFEPVFIPYNNQQGMAIFDLQGLIPEHHVARVIDRMVESIEDNIFYQHYKGGGRSSYHPKMMVKVLLYAYSQKVYSCREIAKLLEENIPAMWLAAMQKPDYRTINRFRTHQMAELLPSLFEEMILKLMEEKFITLENYFLDGTKIEANANKLTYVWKKAINKNETKLLAKIEEMYQQIQSVANQENEDLHAEESKKELTVEQKLQMIESVLEEEVERKKVDWETETEKEVRKEKRRVLGGLKKSLKLVRKNFIPRYLKYQHQKELLGDRNSYSKTNPDATFMRMKDDHMKNGQLKPGYNVQMATENQFILFYSVHQRPTDTRCLIPHLEAYRQTNLPMPKRVVADAGYGSEENYRYLIGDSETEPIAEFLIPYNTYLKEKTKGYRHNPYNAKNWDYVEEDDLFICPNGRRVPFKKYMKKKNASGFVQDFKI
ncbi:IS1182 family transposase [Neobacillus piezotolerans]|nr:IS1182 family transposase [Neobacillus piezotolerans]